MIKFKCNCCDGKYNSFDVHFTSACDNNCAHCIDKLYEGTHQNKPNIAAIIRTIIKNSDGVDDVLFLGGEPCLYLDELLKCVSYIKRHTDLKVYVTTSVPKICYDKYETFIKLIEICDGINLSVQHYDEEIADKIRRTKSQYDRQSFYASLPYKDKIRINLNIVKPYLCTKEEIKKCLCHYDDMGFNSIKLSEIQHGSLHYVNFEKLFNIQLKSPFAHGCQTYINMQKIIPGFRTPVLLKRSCFMCENSLQASFADYIKAKIQTVIFKPKNKYAVIYENGKISKGWV